MKVIVTGANGFLGSHICSEALRRHFQVVGGVRKSSKLHLIHDLRNLQLIQLDYQLETMVGTWNQLKSSSPVDLFIHCAGVVSSKYPSHFYEINEAMTQRLLMSLKESNLLSANALFIYISSMAAKGPVGYGKPISEYGRSKLAAETLVKTSGLPYAIIRPTAIYGPGDMAFLPLFRTAKRGFYFTMTRPSHQMTLIHAEDLCRVILNLSIKDKGKTYHLNDGHIYGHQDLMEALKFALNRPLTNIKIPEILVKSALSTISLLERVSSFEAFVNKAKYLEISSDWNHTIAPEEQINYTYRPLREGFDDTVKFYEKNNLL